MGITMHFPRGILFQETGRSPNPKISVDRLRGFQSPSKWNNGFETWRSLRSQEYCQCGCSFRCECFSRHPVCCLTLENHWCYCKWTLWMRRNSCCFSIKWFWTTLVMAEPYQRVTLSIQRELCRHTNPKIKSPRWIECEAAGVQCCSGSFSATGLEKRTNSLYPWYSL